MRKHTTPAVQPATVLDYLQGKVKPVYAPKQLAYCNACHIGLVVEDEQCGILVCNS